MRIQKVNIATARINGLTNSPYYFEHRCFFAWSIMFSERSSLFFDNLPFIKVGDTFEEAESFCDQLKKNFKKAHIHDGDKVAILFGNDQRVRAIGCIGRDLWIDVENKFVTKTFKELNVKIKALKIH